jgi:chromosome segregation ATPase
MTQTKKRTREAEGVEDLNAEIEAMEAELVEGYGQPLTWEEVTSTTAEELARKEQRRGILPRLIHAAKVRRLELEKLRREEEAAPLREKLEATYAAFQEQEDQLRQAKEERDAAHSEWTLTLSALQSADERTRRTEKELRELRECGR